MFYSGYRERAVSGWTWDTRWSGMLISNWWEGHIPGWDRLLPPHMVTAPCDDVWAHRLAQQDSKCLNWCHRTHLQNENDSVNCPSTDRECLFIFSLRMTGESNQVCHACHDPPQILISLQNCILCSSRDNGTDGNWSIIMGPGPG